MLRKPLVFYIILIGLASLDNPPLPSRTTGSPAPLPQRPTAPSCRSQRQVPAGTVLRPRMQIPSGRLDARVPQRGLHQVNRRPAIQRMRRTGMPEPVRRNRQLDAGPLGRSAHRRGQRLQAAPSLLLARSKDGIVHAGLGRAQVREQLPGVRLQGCELR